MLKTSESQLAGKMLKAVMDGNGQILYNSTMRDGAEYKFFSRYRDDEGTIRVENEEDPEQMYFKGLYDGMKLCFDLMEQVVENMEEN